MDIETLAKANELSSFVAKLDHVNTDIIINKNRQKKVTSIIINYEDFDRPVYININLPSNDRLQKIVNAINGSVESILKEDRELFNNLK